MSCFDPPKIIERFQAGEWSDHPLYCDIYKNIQQKQSKVIRLAEDLRSFQLRQAPYDSPKNPQATILEREFLKAVENNDTAYFKRLLKAGQLLKNGGPKWCFTLPDLIKLAFIDLRENRHRRGRISRSELCHLIREWQRTNDPSTTFDESYWYRTLQRPDIAELLTLQENK
jgi:hypothetical protein